MSGYLEKGIRDVNTEDCLDQGTIKEVTDGDVGQEDIVRGAGELGKVTESDAKQKVRH